MDDRTFVRGKTPAFAGMASKGDSADDAHSKELRDLMTPTLRRKLEALAERREELERLLGEPAVIGDNNQFRRLSREFAQLEPVANALQAEVQAKNDLASAEAMRNDPELRELAEEEIAAATARLEKLDAELLAHLIPKDARDEGDIYLEVRAGTGGDEAAIFAGDLFRMYSRYAERQGWKVEIESASAGEHGGFKEVIARVEGRGAYSKLKFESGTHRVQRVPETESQGRIHTSAATVAIIPVEVEGEPVEINPADLRVDTFRSSGAGGQHVNKTESAIRITHVPTGIVVESQTERSQHANRDKAMKRLAAIIAEAQAAKAAATQAETRKLQVGSGDRSQRVRTYNFPQGRITDHRVEGLTLYDLPNVIEGNLDGLVDRLQQEHQADELARLTQGA
jgi:peptide chain release factor 1